MKYKTITFYKFFNVKKPEELIGYFRGLCEALDLKGRILIAEEGINAGISGKKRNIEIFKEKIKTKKQLHDLTFREHEVHENSYHKLVVRVRDEIVAFGEKVNLKKKANYISPKKLDRWFTRNEDFVILDTRNDYESKVGKFKNALTLPIETFRDFPKAVEKIENLKDKKIVTYCTGGIRCEKAATYLKEKGFKNVLQLKGGIINYVEKFPGKNFEGACFVFDDRLTSETGSENKLGQCGICGVPCNDYTDCHNLDCDRLFICCENCKIKMNNTCSEECKNAERLRTLVASN